MRNEENTIRFLLYRRRTTPYNVSGTYQRQRTINWFQASGFPKYSFDSVPEWQDRNDTQPYYRQRQVREDLEPADRSGIYRYTCVQMDKTLVDRWIEIEGLLGHETFIVSKDRNSCTKNN